MGRIPYLRYGRLFIKMELFASDPKRIDLQDSWIYFDPDYLHLQEADALFLTLKNSLNWQQSDIRIFGKTYPTPRLEAYHAEKGEHYGYSGKTLQVNAFTPELLQLKKRIEAQFDLSFNAVLANLYRSGQDSNGWHADNEAELGKNPQIASLSLGTSRKFDLKHNKSGEKISLELNHGSLLLMGGSLQHHWKHQIPKTNKLVSERINLTFRKIV